MSQQEPVLDEAARRGINEEAVKQFLIWRSPQSIRTTCSRRSRGKRGNTQHHDLCVCDASSGVLSLLRQEIVGRDINGNQQQISGEGAISYLHHDQQGSTRMLTGSTGIAAGTTTYDAYGNRTGSTGTGTTPLGYDGQYTSSDTGLIYLRARSYDPATAQFITVDPLDEGSNTLAYATIDQYVAAAMRSASRRAPYAYANDNPVNKYDPTGLFTAGICVHGEVNFIVHIGVSGCIQGSTSGEVGGTVVGSAGLAQGASVGATVGPQVSSAEHISELSGPFANAGGQLGVGPDVSLEAFGAPGECGPVVGGGVSAGIGLGAARWVGGSYTGAWSVSF